ncbi:MAG: hypothetical protein Q9M94_03995 [Candidatus Gracilibacteria bacterium]|nr:hypothetical protein [Candidatus Gracilibacteria bacterium]MDQ7023241.1 hypothetical protein [Candidatus Gracilibacteria bacterium]
MNNYRKIKKSRKIGDNHFYKGYYKKALKSYLRALKYMKLDNRLIESIYLNLSFVYSKLEDYINSLFYVEEGLKISGGDYDLLLRKAHTLEKLGKKEESEILFSKINKIDNEMNNMELDLNKFYKN